MHVVFIFFLPFMFVDTSIPALMIGKENYLKVFTTILSCLLTFGFLLVLYYLIPNRDMRWRETWCGALIATIALQISFLLFPLYVHNFLANYVGQLGFAIILLLLFYVFGLLIVLGAQINAYFFSNIQPLSDGLGSCLSQANNQEYAHLLNETDRSNNSNDNFMNVITVDNQQQQQQQN